MNIASMRLKSGMTQRELSENIGVAISTVAMWETGKSTPRVSTLPKLARILGCSVDELLGLDKEEGGEKE